MRSLDGTLSVDDAIAAVGAAARDAEDRAAPLLIDMRRATIPGFSYRDAHTISEALLAQGIVFSRRVALLDLYDEAFLVTQFFEASAAARGFPLKAFVDEAAARAWLAHE